MSKIVRSSISAKASLHNFREYQHGGYFTTKDEQAYFQHLRDVGCSNAEIAKLTGRSYATVYNHIGKQPIVMSKANVEFGKARHYQRLEERKQIVAMVAEYNEQEKARALREAYNNVIDLTERLKIMRAKYEALKNA